MQKARWIGLDVGGANIKVADTEQRASALDFPLWKHPEMLSGALKKLIGVFRKSDKADHVAVTMTGELADCFETKREGVAFIANACVEAAGAAEVVFYSVKGDFLSLSKAIAQWEEVAASNWHALASWIARNSPTRGPGLVIDVGSTTTDLVPFRDREVCCRGWNDTERLLAGELVYTGVERSSIAGITPKLPLRGKFVPVMNELFATSLDAWLLLGEMAEDAKNTSTADGRPATKAFAHARLARMVGGDSTTISRKETLEMAHYLADRQARLIAAALQKHRRRHPRELHFTGHGKFLAKRAQQLVPMANPYEREDFGADQGPRCAPAVAVAALAQEHFP